MNIDPPFTSDEDYLLLQSYVMHPGEYNEIAKAFNGRRTADRLQKRWEELNESMLPDQLDVFEHFKKSENQYKQERYIYGEDITYEYPDIDTLTACYNEVPSLTQKSQEMDADIPDNTTTDFTGLNEFTLNQYFDTKTVLDIITKTFNETIPDIHLREMLYLDFKLSIHTEGQKLAIKDISRRIAYVNDKLTKELQDKEFQYIIVYYTQTMDFIKFKAASYCQHSSQRTPPSVLLLDLGQILYYMSKVHWPGDDIKPAVLKLKQDCDKIYLSACAALLNYIEYTGIQKYDRLIDSIIKYDPEERIDIQLHGTIQTHFRQRRMMNNQAMRMPQPQIMQYPMM